MSCNNKPVKDIIYRDGKWENYGLKPQMTMQILQYLLFAKAVTDKASLLTDFCTSTIIVVTSAIESHSHLLFIC